MKVAILYEDKDVLVVNKPAGLLVHPDGSHLTPALSLGRRGGSTEVLTDWILQKYPKIKGVGEPMTLSNGDMIDRPGIVHRLDKDTSGVMVIAKTQQAYAFLKRQFETRTIEKNYLALVVGTPKDATGMIDMPIGRSASDFRKWSAKGARNGELREAKTAYKFLEKLGKYSFLELHPKTGRTHQIRVHLAAIGHPVACDSLYGQKGTCPHGGTRQLLHAASIKLALPKGGIKTLEAPLPKDFKDVLAKLRKSC